MTSLKGKSVIITGASSGIGAEAARLLAREGCRVALAARRASRLRGLAREIRAHGGEAIPLPTDVTKPAQIGALVRSVLSAYGQIDILFNNAGFGRLDWLERLKPSGDIRRQIEVNLLGVIWMTHAVLPHMYARGGGTIINMSSMAGWAAPPLYSIYSATKFGVRGFTEAVRREAANFNVRVCILYPAGTETEFGEHIGTSAAKLRFSTPPALRLNAQDVARSVVRIARRPRREVILPWWMGVPRFLNSHLGSFSDYVQSRLFKPYHTL